MNWEEVTRALTAPLDTAAIKPPPKGKFGEYVEGLHCIQEANRIFGHNGWNYRVTRLEEASNIQVALKGHDGEYTQARVSFLCTVLVTVDGVEREGSAVGVGNGKPENLGDVIESAVKEAETDALKRALRTFGNTFGLALYEKDHSKREVADTSRAQEAAKAIDGVMSGRDLLAVVNQYADVQAHPEAADARISKLRDIVRGAQNEQALDALAKHFAPDLDAISTDIDLRKDELRMAA